MRHKLNVRVRGALLLGGGERANTKTTLRDLHGEPYIPASALKGAIREQLRRLCGAEAADTIFGKAGHATRLDGGSSGVYLSDATPVDDGLRQAARRGAGYALRTHVALDRRTRRAAGERLFNREVFAPPADVVLQAEVDTAHLSDEQRALFTAAVRAVFALGAGRSGGLGAVEMELEAAAVPEPQSRPAQGPCDLVLELEALDPLCLGGARYTGNFHRSLEVIPASTLRGAVVSAAMRTRGITSDQSDEPIFRRTLLDADKCLRFGDAVAVGDGVLERPRRVPFSLRVCKNAACRGRFDTLAQNWLVRALAGAGHFVAADESCPACGGRTVVRPGWQGGKDPLLRVVTRVGLDAATARAADGQLFSLELVERGTLFLAPVRNVDADGLRLLEDALGAGLRVGRGCGQGYGRVRVRALRPVGADDLGPRVEALDRAMRAAVEALPAAVRSPGEGTFLVATLENDLAAPGTQPHAEQAFLGALGLGRAEILGAQVRAGQRGGYDTKASGARGEDMPKAYFPVVAGGSTLLVRVERPLDGALLSDMERLERHGAGLRREEGMGWVRFSDALHLSGGRA